MIGTLVFGNRGIAKAGGGMATQAEKLARSLEALAVVLAAGGGAVRARDVSRTHRARLVEAGFLREVMKGWYVPSQPDQPVGESTSWYFSYWGFCADYLEARFGDGWCLSPEQSLMLHAGNRTVPGQLVVRCPRGDNAAVMLPHATSLLSVRSSLPPVDARTVVDGLRVYRPAAALSAVAKDFFTTHETDARAALAMVRDASEVLPVLLERGHSTIAGRLAGAFANSGRERIAADIEQAMRAAGHVVRRADPFARASLISPVDAEPPHVRRLRLMWHGMRDVAAAHFPAAPAGPIDADTYLRLVDDAYVSDAYHSLSIEGYQVSRDLVARIREGRWCPDSEERDRDQRHALAAKGYWQSLQQVRRSLARVLAGENPGVVADQDHGAWYRELVGPEVTAGLRRPADLAGYRDGTVLIRQSRHIPPAAAAVRDLMPVFFELLGTETDPAARAVLGHFVFVYIHPYPDGNGRVGRFLMNVMMAAGGYPWTIIPVERRSVYMEALEQASTAGDVAPFARMLGELVARA